MWPGGLLKGPLHGFAECEGCSETNEGLGLVSKKSFLFRVCEAGGGILLYP